MMKRGVLRCKRTAFTSCITMLRRKKEKRYEKDFKKNSSLITKLHKGLAVNALECDELHFQLITSEVNGLLRDEYGKQLITT